MSRFFRQQGDSDSDTEESEEELMSSDDEAVPSRPQPAAKPTGMARFLKGAGGSSSSSSSSEDEDSDDDDSDDEKPAKKKSNYLVGADSDGDSDEETRKVVKSAKDKRLDEMEAVGKSIDNAININDWVAISNEFDKLVRLVERQTNVAERIPSFFIKSLIRLESALNTALAKEKEAKKKMNAPNARALNTMKQKVRKTSKEYEKEVKQYQEDPEGFEREYAAAQVVVPVARPKKVKVADAEGSGDEDFTTVGKSGKAMTFTSESIFKNLQVIQEARGRKHTDRAEQIKILEKLLEVAETVYQRIRVLLALISSRFDYNTSITSHMVTDLWGSAQREVDQLITLLAANPHYSVEEATEDYDELIERKPETEKGGIVRIRGSIISFIDRLDDEFTKSLQNIDPHGTEYVERLRDEKGLYHTICLSQGFYEKTKQEDPLGRVILRRLEHIYSKPDAVVQALESSLSNSTSPPSVTLATTGDSKALIKALCTHLYKSGNPVLKTRAMLCHIYHHALHNDFYTARDMLLMSHLQESIHGADAGTQILHNRTIVQIGLCAFRIGLIREAQAALQEICATQRTKELLAQGIHAARYTGALTAEQEKAERQRQLPFHMHINTELLEAAFLVSSMLVEIPLLASIDNEEQKRKVVSKPFRRLLDFADRQVFTGPPESTRDHIMQASKALQNGDWERCRDLIQSIKIWSLMPEAGSVKDMLSKRIQEEALRTYLFTYAPHYQTLSLETLARTFSLPLKAVTSIVSKMIWNEELAASLDQGLGVVVFHHVEFSKAQQLANTLAERLGTLVESSEKALDAKQGNNTAGTGWGDRTDGTKGERRGEQTQERTGRSERTRGASTRGARGGRGARFAQGLGNRMQGVPATARVR